MSDHNTKTTTEEEVKYVNIKCGDFDKSHAQIKDPQTIEFKVGNVSVKSTTSDGIYLNEQGEECELYFTAPKQFCFGVSYKFDLQVKKDDQTPEKAKGLQICYQATSLKTVDNPTPEEASFIQMLNLLWELVVEKGRFEASRKPLLIPAPSRNSYLAAKESDDMTQFVKLPLQKPKPKPEDRGPKPFQLYVNLMTKGNGLRMACHTKIYGPGDKPISPLGLIDQRGTLEPCFKWDGVYWGSHGPNSSCGASLRFKLVEANFSPDSYAPKLPKGRLLPRNESKTTGSDDHGEGAGNGDGDDPSPMKTLLSSGGRAPMASKPVIKTRPALRPGVPMASGVKPKVAVKPMVRAKPKPTPPPPPAEEPEEQVEEEQVQEDEQ